MHFADKSSIYTAETIGLLFIRKKVPRTKKYRFFQHNIQGWVDNVLCHCIRSLPAPISKRYFAHTQTLWKLFSWCAFSSTNYFSEQPPLVFSIPFHVINHLPGSGHSFIFCVLAFIICPLIQYILYRGEGMYSKGLSFAQGQIHAVVGCYGMRGICNFEFGKN